MGDGDFDLTMDELRAGVRFAADCAQELLPDFEAVAPENSRPRDAISAARVFADGVPRSNLQRTAAYLHPIAKASQVGQILRAAACAARVSELRTDTTDSDAVRVLAARAAPPLPEILGRYPVAPSGSSRVAQLLSALDSAIRDRN